VAADMIVVILIAAAMITIAGTVAAIYVLSPSSLALAIENLLTGKNSDTEVKQQSGLPQELQYKRSEIMQDFQRWQIIENCYNAPSAECDKKMIAIMQECNYSDNNNDNSQLQDQKQSPSLQEGQGLQQQQQNQSTENKERISEPLQDNASCRSEKLAAYLENRGLTSASKTK
jgi:hypothetical protein